MNNEEHTEEVVDSASQSQQEGKWYVVHTQSGFEAKSKEALEQRIKSLGFEDRIF